MARESFLGNFRVAIETHAEMTSYLTLLLATLGVLITAGITGIAAAWIVGLPVLPGLLLTAFFLLYIVAAAVLRPDMVGESRERVAREPPAIGKALLSTLLVVGLVLGTLGGIWLGAFTPTEGAGVGAAASLVLAIGKGLRAREIAQVILAVGRTSAPLLLLLVMETLRSALVLGLDGWTFLDPDKVWVVTGWTGMSRVVGTQARITALQEGPGHYLQRPDASRWRLERMGWTITVGSCAARRSC